MRIMFLGTPEISAICLEKLIADGHNVVAVVTGEDKPRGRGNVMTPTATKALAIEKGIPTYTPKTLRDGAFMEILNEVKPDLLAVVAYGKILPREVLEFPKYGCINAHVSLLPKYRGAAPMQRAIIDGESITGVTIMQMDVGLDTGDIIEQESFPILPDYDFEAVHDKSAEVGGRLLSKVIFDIEAGVAKRVKQDNALATYAEKIEKEDCKVDFTKSAKTIDFQIRGVTPIPGAFAYLNGKMIKILRATVDSGKGEAGKVLHLDGIGDGGIVVACGEGAINITRIKPEGKGAMSAGDFVRGRKIAEGDRFE